MKIKLENKWALVCSHTSVDMNTNLLSIFSVIDELTVNPPHAPLPELPKDGFMIPFQHEFVSMWSRDLSESSDELRVKAKLRFLDQNSSVMLERDIEMVFEKGKKNLRFMIKTDALKVKNTGEYAYEIVINDESVKPEKAAAKFNVKLS